MECEDLAVIGAGIYGLIMAKTYLEANPSHKVLILDANPSIGGVWSPERLYPGLHSNNVIGSYEFSDFPMDPKKYGIKPGSHIPGRVINQYLADFVEKFDLLSHIQANSKVETIEKKADDTWILTVNRSGESSTILTNRLVLATGMASEPNIPHYKNEGSFGKPVFHFRDFPKYASPGALKNLKRVAVTGSAKSAWDAAHHYASSGVPVDFIIRKSGMGPNWMAPTKVTPFKAVLEYLLFMRFITWFSPCIWGDADGYGWIRSFLHHTAVGRIIVNTFFSILQRDVIALNGYDKNPETKKLQPWWPAFWAGAMLSILNYSVDFFELVRSGIIKVHIADIDDMSAGTIHLSDGEEIEVDLLCCATGWKHEPNIKFLPAGIEKELGLPYHSTDAEPDQLTIKADAEIFERFPRLKSQPDFQRGLPPLSPGGQNAQLNHGYRLYRFAVPPAYVQKRNIGFSGMLVPTNTTITAQNQALWLTALFSGKLEIAKTREELEWDTELAVRGCRWRHPTGYGERYPDFAFDTLPYFDLLLKDLGPETHRKPGMFADIFQHYGPSDYRGLVEEWKEVVDEKTSDSVKGSKND